MIIKNNILIKVMFNNTFSGVQNLNSNVLTIDILEDLTRVVTDEIIDELSRLDEDEPHFSPASPEHLESLQVLEYNTTDGEEFCSICLEKMKDKDKYIKTSCDHCFHERCLKSWLMIDNSCPVCRVRQEKEEVSPNADSYINDNNISNEPIEPNYELNNTIFLTIFFPNRSILYKSFDKNMLISEFINKLGEYMNDHLVDKRIFIKNISLDVKVNMVDILDKSLEECNFGDGSQIKIFN